MNTDHTTGADLRDLIHQLTQTHKTAVYQHGELLRYRDDNPLLEALRAAIAANIGQGSGGKAAHERSTLNIGALELHETIRTRVKQWAINADVPRHWHLTAGHPIDWTDTSALLRAWHIRTLSDAHFDETPYNDTLRGWVRQITDLVIDPPRRFTLNAPCPLCNQRWVLDPDGHQLDALAVTERDPADESTTLCRNCDTIWPGINGARQLRIAIDDAAEAA